MRPPPSYLSKLGGGGGGGSRGLGGGSGRGVRPAPSHGVRGGGVRVKGRVRGGGGLGGVAYKDPARPPPPCSKEDRGQWQCSVRALASVRVPRSAARPVRSALSACDHWLW